MAPNREPGTQGRTLYRAIASDLRKLITTGELAPGATLPTEKDVAEQYKVSRNTVRLAFDQLASEGLITSTRGRGREVRRREPVWIYASRSESRARRRPSGVDSWVDDMHAQGREAATSISIAVVQAPGDVASRLKIAPGELVCVRRRVRLADGQPWNINDSYYSMELAKEFPELLDPSDVTTGITVHLADRGYAQKYYIDELTCRMPTPEESNTLQIGPGIPVMCHTRTGHGDTAPIRVTITILPGDRHRMLYEIPA